MLNCVILCSLNYSIIIWVKKSSLYSIDLFSSMYFFFFAFLKSSDNSCPQPLFITVSLYPSSFFTNIPFNGWYFWNKIPINQLKSKINILINAIFFLCLRLNRRRHLHKIYLPFVILEISGVLASSMPKIPFHRTSEKIFDDIWKFSLTIIGYFWYKRDA